MSPKSDQQIPVRQDQSGTGKSENPVQHVHYADAFRYVHLSSGSSTGIDLGTGMGVEHREPHREAFLVAPQIKSPYLSHFLAVMRDSQNSSDELDENSYF